MGTQEQIAWVSVDEQLPDDETEVLVSYTTKYGRYLNIAALNQGDWYLTDGAPLFRAEVTHWAKVAGPV